ncbi:hypothetical protein Aph02nite_94690 [Actinoplanes philippinensis]|nr:hypothetical protein Aph02nite_94690 [Actinoplanes philippinensis]
MPLIPNDDTAARRARPSTGHGRARDNNRTPEASQSTCDDATSPCNDRGINPYRIACTILITPPTPAAAWACPMFDFNDPNHTGRPARPYVACNARTSIGSPNRVPVP